MKTAGSLSEIDKLFDTILQTLEKEPSVQRMKMFGSVGLKVKGKVFTFLWKDTLVVKLPKERVEELIKAGNGKLFDPGHGRTSKEWIAIKPLTKDKWRSFANEAKDFVASL